MTAPMKQEQQRKQLRLRGRPSKLDRKLIKRKGEGERLRKRSRWKKLRDSKRPNRLKLIDKEERLRRLRLLRLNSTNQLNRSPPDRSLAALESKRRRRRKRSLKGKERSSEKETMMRTSLRKKRRTRDKELI